MSLSNGQEYSPELLYRKDVCRQGDISDGWTNKLLGWKGGKEIKVRKGVEILCLIFEGLR